MLSVILKRTKASSQDVIMEEIGIEEKYNTKLMNQSLRLKVSQFMFQS